MSDSAVTKPVKIHKLPLLIRKNTITTYDKLKPNNLYLRRVENAQQNYNVNRIFKEDIIYKAQENDIFSGKYPNLIIKNRLNVVKNTSRTVATYMDNSSIVELSSDNVSNLIGQKNYDLVFSALCSVISQDLKVQGILSLLCLDKKISSSGVKGEDKSSQTDETCREIFMRNKRKRVSRRKQVRSYAISDDMLTEKRMKKVIIDPKSLNLIAPEKIKVESDHNKTFEKKIEEESVNRNSSDTSRIECLPDLKLMLDEDSNISDSSVGNISIGSCNIPNILENPKSLLNNIDKHTDTSDLTTVRMIDDSVVMIPGNPDIFHLASRDILENLSSQDRKKILLHQAYIDWKFCLQADCDGYLPLHKAVLNKDVDLVKRQCIVLKMRHQSVDVALNGNPTALQLSLIHDCAKCTAILLQYGADPLIPDEESRTPLHLAAEASSENVKAILDHCRANARAVLRDNEGMWRDSFDSKSDEDLAEFLIYKMCIEYDNQGYTPLMLASRMGTTESVKLLIQASPETINVGMPNCGNTALYLAVSTVCLSCQERGDVEEKFMDTIGVLIENGADPAINNTSGSNVNTLLTEFCISKLSMLIANKLMEAIYVDVKKTKNFDSYMLLKDSEGRVNLREIKPPKGGAKQPSKAKEVKAVNEKTIKVNSAKGDISKVNTAKAKVYQLPSAKDKINKVDTPEQNIQKVDSDKGEIQKVNTDNGKTKNVNSRKGEVKNESVQTDPGDNNAVERIKQKPLILQDIPVTNIGQRPVTSQSVHPVSMIVSDPNILKLNEQHLIPVTLKGKKQIKFVKILPKTTVMSSTGSSTTGIASTSSKNISTKCTSGANTSTQAVNTDTNGITIKRSLSPSDSKQSSKKSKVCTNVT